MNVFQKKKLKKSQLRSLIYRFNRNLRQVMGINKNFIRKGVGSKLMEEGISWCKKQSFIDWVDLGVFEDNIPAQKRYAKYSFEEVSRKKDAYRVADKQINLINMCLRL